MPGHPAPLCPGADRRPLPGRGQAAASAPGTYLGDAHRAAGGERPARRGSLPARRHTDVDISARILRVRDSKFGKSRDVPIHETTVTALKDYAQVRNRLRVNATTDAFFVSGRGTRLNRSNLEKTFAVLRNHAGLDTVDRPVRHGCMICGTPSPPRP
ncbi:tyrosine-type recombinase/integrase [Arthrobacter bambusae]|uniref:tyrosine-type recombinase/integrase n=1 Tax=Arthrobacter bambusae TaxID=1338426 RepID=UPI003556E298|nr:tyrosine-type recombinase/integrase [Arthrobacter bambusae]